MHKAHYQLAKAICRPLKELAEFRAQRAQVADILVERRSNSGCLEPPIFRWSKSGSRKNRFWEHGFFLFPDCFFAICCDSLES